LGGRERDAEQGQYIAVERRESTEMAEKSSKFDGSRWRMIGVA
jgi:hypothetical protein